MILPPNYLERTEPLSAVDFEWQHQGRLGGSAVERLPLAQGMIPESPDRVPHQAPCAWSLLLLSLPLSVFLMNE